MQMFKCVEVLLILCMEISYQLVGFLIGKKHYANDILWKFNMSNIHPVLKSGMLWLQIF